jgi:hypothetical protein
VNSLNRVWKYDHGGKELLAAGNSLNQTTYGGFVSSGAIGHQLIRNNSTQKYLGQNQSHHFLTSSGSKANLASKQ